MGSTLYCDLSHETLPVLVRTEALANEDDEGWCDGFVTVFKSCDAYVDSWHIDDASIQSCVF